jgi:hypothetical protein
MNLVHACKKEKEKLKEGRKETKTQGQVIKR